MLRDGEVLQRLLKPAEPVRRFCTIEELLPDGRYVVADDRRRRLTVDGAAGYLPGAAVIVQSGRIVGYGSRTPVSKTWRV